MSCCVLFIVLLSTKLSSISRLMSLISKVDIGNIFLVCLSTIKLSSGLILILSVLSFLFTCMFCIFSIISFLLCLASFKNLLLLKKISSSFNISFKDVFLIISNKVETFISLFLFKSLSTIADLELSTTIAGLESTIAGLVSIMSFGCESVFFISVGCSNILSLCIFGILSKSILSLISLNIYPLGILR